MTSSDKKKMKWKRITTAREYGFHEQPDGTCKNFDVINRYYRLFETKPTRNNPPGMKTHHISCLDCNGRRYVRHFIVQKVEIIQINNA